jgi:hypothetical protein
MADQLFSDNQENPQATPEQNVTPSSSSSDVFADQLAAIKNEQGEQKYGSLEDAIKALKHSQEYIPSLKSELSTKDEEIMKLRAELEARKSVEELVSQSATPQEVNQPQGLSEEDIEKLLESKLTQRQQQELASSNLNSVVSTLKQRYGEHTQAKIQEKAAELGYKPSELQKLAEKSPKLVLSLFGNSQSTPTPTTGGQFVPNQAPQEVGKVKGLLAGAKSSDLKNHWKSIQSEIYEKHGITG